MEKTIEIVLNKSKKGDFELSEFAKKELTRKVFPWPRTPGELEE
jgi:hypothetical protein|tara:strand:+ start:1684 stop:1815 length:132 start_codon:yes stop_codon:yes gene_type:complete